MSSSGDRAAELIAEAADLPYGDVKVSLLEEAVKQVDVTRDRDFMFATRMDLVNAAIFSGHYEVAITAFAWCLAAFEEDRQRFGDHQFTVLWQFKNILLNVDRFPQISYRQFENLAGQMAELYRRSGYNLRTVHFARMTFAIANGDRPTAREAYAAFNSQPRDAMAHCEACEADFQARYFDFIDQPQKAVQAARRILNGSLSCTEVPHRTYSLILRPLALLKRHDEADEYQTKGYRLIRNNPTFTAHVALQIEYLLHRDRLVAAARMLEHHFAWALDTHVPYSRYRLFVACKLLMSALATAGSKLQIKLPPQITLHNVGTNSQAFANWLEKELREIGSRFDERNGNNFMTKELPERCRY